MRQAFSVLTRAWRVTWRHGTLWLFGLVVGALGMGINFSAWIVLLFTFWGPAWPYHFRERLLLAPAVGLFVLYIIARGGIVRIANEVTGGGAGRIAEGWRTGVSMWRRVLGIDALVAVPVALVVGTVALLPVEILPAGTYLPSTTFVVQTDPGLLLVFGVLHAALLVAAGVEQLAVLHAVLEDRHTISALREGWRDLWAQRDALTMLGVMILLGLALGVTLGILSSVLIGFPPLSLFQIGVKAGYAGSVVLVGLLWFFPVTLWASCCCVGWTIFFRLAMDRHRLPPNVTRVREESD